MSKHAKAKPVDVDEATSLNLVPMVDIMFLMLLFFMLGSDMGQRELEAVTLPLASTIKEDKGDAPKEGRTTINVYHDIKRGATCETYAKADKDAICRNDEHWKVGIRGHDYNPKIKEEVDKLRGLLKRDSEEGKSSVTDRVSERLVMIRADAKAPYGAVQQVMNVCAECGIYKIEVGAAAPAPE
ncbi:MAG: biopolymer transporter ExbD [Candidatus Brocadiae bacterium]|nr:biopolymer transporter ExbD [Candidatus Brocadiia bacterium]